MCSYQLESHPGNPLQKHLSEVAENTVRIVRELQSICHFLVGNDVLTAARIIGFCHDIGKSTSYFQDYLHTHKIIGDPFLKSHSTSSSLYGYFVSSKHVSDQFLGFLTMMLIQGHHGKISSPKDSVLRIFKYSEQLKRQIDSVQNKEELSSILSKQSYPSFVECKPLATAHLSFHKSRGDLVRHLEEKISLKPYFLSNLLFSALLDSDRMNAAGIMIQERADIEGGHITRFAEKIDRENKARLGKNSEIIRLRDKVRESVLANLDTETRIFSLTAPTGSGKTLTSLLFASRLREELAKKSGRNARIVYVAPFLSIIDQNASVIRQALGIDESSQSPVMVTHHHLSRLSYQDAGEETYSTSLSGLLIEGWNAEVIVTTFVQFFETIVGARASSLRKLHNIAGSIIILDEVQAIDYTYWKLIHDCLDFISRELDVRIILMTATQPLIFKKNEVKELFDTRFKVNDRVNLNINIQRGISLDNFSDKVRKIIKDNLAKSVLIIMNTVQSAVSVFDSLPFESGEEKFFLSSQVIPAERRERINTMARRLAEGKRTILVSTQVVEAGVDIDFDLAIRDLAPVDSIIQAAGRCNRNGKRNPKDSMVYVYAVHDAEEHYFANRIYGNVLVEKARETLGSARKDLAQLAEDYYQNVAEGANNTYSDELLQAMALLDYEKVDEFKIIDEEPTEGIFVEADESAVQLWRQYKEAALDMAAGPIRAFLRANRESFYNYVINIRADGPITRQIPFENGFHYITRSSLSDHYCYTGLVESSNII